MDSVMAEVRFEETRAGEILGGRYVLGSLIGKGGHGEVYRARDIVDQRDVAIKVLARQLAMDQDYRVRLVREARAMSALGGAGTIEILGVIGAEDGTPCVVMELLEGMDLGHAMRERAERGVAFRLDEVLVLFVPIVRTLDQAHARDIIHRDLKPSNIYLVGGGLDDPRIMDFGLAKAGDLASITADQMLAGSPSYIAPEIWEKGAKAASRQSDVYSVACVLYQTLAGDVPIWRESLADMLLAVTSPDTRPSLHGARPDLPVAVDDWLQQALAVDPAQRFQSVVAMWRAFRGVVEG
jgi:serine/threonine protein kinase